jgi:glycerol-3-phosphate dehydrogenase
MPSFDIIVIGGGVNGAGIARDAVGRGASVLLLEQGDLAQGTSSASTKLIHGGLRYLEHYEFGLVRESLSERERLWAIAPHIIWPLRFILPHRKGLRPAWLLRLGLFLYDHIGGRKLLPATQTVDLKRHVAGKPLQPGFGKAFEYSDGWVDDARLVVLNARDAADKGAQILTRHQVTDMLRSGDHWVIHTATPDGKTESFTAGAVVNAAGPYVLELIERAHITNSRKMRLVRGSHIVTRRLFDHEYAYFFQLADNRIFFAIPYERDFTLIGTTDQDHVGNIADAKASAEEIGYLCAGVNEYFGQQISAKDVVWTYSGVRPLLDDGSGKPEAATRGYMLELSDATDGPALLNVFGGKITSYRHLAQSAVDKLAARVPSLLGAAWTADAALPGGDFAVTDAAKIKVQYAADYPFLDTDNIDRIVKAYGTLAKEWLADAKAASDLGEDFGHGLHAAEVDYLVRQEWAQSAEDVLWRRSKLGLHFSMEETQRLSQYLENLTLAMPAIA